MARLFKAYVIIHWSAAAKPTTGADAVWIGVLKPDVRFRLAFDANNPSTRGQAEAHIAQILADRVKRRERTLVGFDFPLGFPRGLAEGLKLPAEAPWRSVWDQLARMVKDRTDNTNNRFGVGSEINRRLTGGPFPFWGCPPRDTLTTLQPKRGREHGRGRRRPNSATWSWPRSPANPMWKLYYNGRWGPQAILGMPMVRRLAAARGEAFRVWPFETGWKALAEADLAGVDVLAAEVDRSGREGHAPARGGQGDDPGAGPGRASGQAGRSRQARRPVRSTPRRSARRWSWRRSRTEEGWVAGRMIGRPIAGLALALVLAGAGARAQDTEVLYRGATLIDVEHGRGRPDMAILTRGERIEAVGPRAGVAAPPGAKIVDARGLYVSPGLINTHEHLATPPNRRFAEAMMRRDLYGGITTVRDMADDLRQLADLSRAARVGEVAGPDIHYAALMAGPEFFEDPRTHATTRGAVAGQVPWMQAITLQTDLPLAVARAAGTGATAIKIYADLPGPLVAAITAEAHRQGALVWAHAAVFPASPAEVIDAGVDTVSHTCMLAYQASETMPRAYHHRAGVDEARFRDGDNPVVQALFDQMRRQGVDPRRHLVDLSRDEPRPGRRSQGSGPLLQPGPGRTPDDRGLARPAC